jgi:hypothetical protein
VPTPNSVIRRMSMAIFTEANLTTDGARLYSRIVSITNCHPHASCHPERSEGSWCLRAAAISVARARTRIPRFARNDRLNPSR